MRKVIIEMWIPDDLDDSDVLDSMQHEAVELAESTLNNDEVPDDDAERIRAVVSITRGSQKEVRTLDELSLPDYF